MPLLEVAKAGWVVIVFLFISFWVPSRLFARKPGSAFMVWTAGNWVRMLLGIAASVFLLTGIKALSSITVIAFILAALAIAWLRNHNWKVGGVVASVQGKTLALVRKAEAQPLTKFVDADAPPKKVSFRIPRWLQSGFWLALLEGREVLIAGFVLVLVISSALLWQNPARQLRYDHVEQYSVLLRGREFALNLDTIGKPFVAPAAFVVTALVSAVDLAQVTRFLSPVIGILLIISLGLFVRICTRTGVAALIAMYCLGAAAFPPTSTAVAPLAISVKDKLLALLAYTPAVTRPGTEFQIGLMLLLLGLTFLADWHRNGGWDSLVDLACCLVLVAVISQYLLVVFLVVGAAMLIGPAIGIVVFFVLCYGLAIYATLVSGSLPNDVYVALPVAAAVGIACFAGFVHSTLTAVTGKRTDAIVLGVFLLLAALWLRPHSLTAQFLEYEAAAQQTRQIREHLPRQRWVVVAPVEQLPETFGFGGYQDLAGFVQEYRTQVASPEFTFKEMPDDILIYVEKAPFQMYSQEPASVSFGTLTDATYRNYRSPAGRASLESDALQLCESYRANHSDSTIYFEDENLRIYRVHKSAKAPN